MPVMASRKAWYAVTMRRGSIWAPMLLLLFAYLVLHCASNLLIFEPRSRSSRSSSSSSSSRNEEQSLPRLLSSSSFRSAEYDELKQQQPLKVYMYELPRKFTFGVVEAYSMSRRKKSLSSPQQNEVSYPGTQHAAEWWIFSDLRNRFSARSSYVRVMDPSEADVLYVSFFSSLSLVVNPKGAGADDDEAYSDEKMQEELMGWLEQQDAWKRNRGRDHVFICQDPNALFRLRDTLKNAVLLLSDFGRFKPGQASLVKDVILPYTHRISSYEAENATVERSTLLFFMGNRYRKEDGKIRDRLFEVLDAEPDMVIKHGMQSREGRRHAAAGMRSSKFCLHPAGDTPSACRLFDAIVSICIPVIVSNDIELPFEDELDYTEFSVFMSASKAIKPGYLAAYLRSISAQELRRKQQRLREVRKYFEYGPDGAAVDMIWQQVRKKLPLIRTMIHRDKRIIPERKTGNCSCVCSFHRDDSILSQ